MAQGAGHNMQLLSVLFRENPYEQARQIELEQYEHPGILHKVHWPFIGISPALQIAQKSADEQATQLWTLHEIQDIPSVLGCKVNAHWVQTPANYELQRVQLVTEHWLTQFPPFKMYPVKQS